jgi:hypothetical protein
MNGLCKAPWKRPGLLIAAFMLALSGCKDIMSALNSDAVSVGGVKVSVTEVTIIPLNGFTAYRGGDLYFASTVMMSNGSANTAGVKWAVAGNKDPFTTIIAPGMPSVTGILVIGPDESAEKLAITATSKADETKKSDPVTVWVIRF